MRPTHWFSALALASTLAGGPLAAQRIQPFPYHPWTPARLAEAADQTPAPDYRWEGMKVGGFFGLAFGAVLGHGICEWSETRRDCTLATIGGALITGVVGVGMGGLIGGLIPKTPADSAQGGDP